MAKIKVFTGGFHGWVWDKSGSSKQGCRVIIATTSQRKVAERTGLSLHEISNYWSVTANAEDIKLAMAHPEKVILLREEYHGDRTIIDIVTNIDENRKRNSGT